MDKIEAEAVAEAVANHLHDLDGAFLEALTSFVDAVRKQDEEATARALPAKSVLPQKQPCWVSTASPGCLCVVSWPRLWSIAVITASMQFLRSHGNVESLESVTRGARAARGGARGGAGAGGEAAAGHAAAAQLPWQHGLQVTHLSNRLPAFPGGALHVKLRSACLVESPLGSPVVVTCCVSAGSACSLCTRTSHGLEVQALVLTAVMSCVNGPASARRNRFLIKLRWSD